MATPIVHERARDTHTETEREAETETSNLFICGGLTARACTFLLHTCKPGGVSAGREGLRPQ